MNGPQLKKTCNLSEEDKFAIQRDLQRFTMRQYSNLSEAFCKASKCRKYTSIDSNKPSCPRNCCQKLAEFHKIMVGYGKYGFETDLFDDLQNIHPVN